jgi:replicative DNA helicase
LDLERIAADADGALSETGPAPEDLFEHFEHGEPAPPVGDDCPDFSDAALDDAKAEETMSDMKGALTVAFTHLQERYAREERLAGAESGYVALDNILDGWERQKVTIVGARSGHGKSMFAVNLGVGIARRGEMVDYITIEMPTKDQALRALFLESGVESHRFKFKTVRPEDWSALVEAVQRIKDIPWIWDDRGTTTVDQIRRQVQIVKRKAEAKGRRLHTVIIDHILNIKGSNERQPRREQVLYITNQLKAIAKAEDVCVIGLTQINRGPEGRVNKRPTIADLKESGSSEEDADNIILLYRADKYKKANEPKDHIVEVIVPKVRGGEEGFVRLREDFNRCQLLPMEEGEDE